MNYAWDGIYSFTEDSSYYLGAIVLMNVESADELESFDPYTIHIPYGVGIVAGEAFYGEVNNKSFDRISMSDTVFYIASGAFYGNSDVTRIRFGENLEIIESTAFYECSSLIYLYFPSKLSFIGTDAFCGCHDSLMFIYFEANQNALIIQDDNIQNAPYIYAPQDLSFADGSYWLNISEYYPPAYIIEILYSTGNWFLY